MTYFLRMPCLPSHIPVASLPGFILLALSLPSFSSFLPKRAHRSGGKLTAQRFKGEVTKFSGWEILVMGAGKFQGIWA